MITRGTADMPDAEATYNLKAVVQKTGIPAASLRAWEKRYGIIAPVRKANGHRVYPVAEVEKLLRLKVLMAQGMSISQAAEQVRSRPTEPTGCQGEVERLRQELAGALTALDTGRANRLFAEALDLLPADELCLRVVRPLLPELAPFGRTYLRSRLGALLLHATAPEPAPTALVINPDPFDLQPLLAAIFLSRRGRRIIYVEGAEAPPGLEAEMVIDPRRWAGGDAPEELF
jgi:MerR family transcriptional regulator, light-induced transcriptional regulator